jgi:hypothetical protein
MNPLLKENIMHSKRKGNIGQFAIALELSKLGYSVFTEEGDISKIDIIAEKDGKLIRIQSKAITPKNNTLTLSVKKSGPDYHYIYEQGIFDFFGIVDLEDGKVYLVPDEILSEYTSSFALRKIPSRNNQSKNVHNAEDYLLEKVLTK